MKRVILLAVLILLISSSYSLAEVPCKINYQGRLIENNVPVHNPAGVPMVFSMDGKSVYSGNVPVYNGLFRVELDLKDIDWTAGEVKYLEVTVDGKPLSPPEPIYAYPYAINSHFLEGKTTAHFLDVSSSTQTKQGGLNIMGNIGIGDDSPQSPLTVGSGDAFQVNSSGDPIKIKNVTYSWPSTQGKANTVLANNGSGTLIWTTPDPWTYVVLGSDFSTNNATAVDVTGLAFAPLANKKYEIYGMFMLRTANVSYGPKLGCRWPTEMTDGVVMFEMTSAAAAQVLQNGNINAAVLCLGTGLPKVSESYPAQMNAMLVAGPTPSGNFQIQLALEAASTTVQVTMKAGSFIKYRIYE